MSTYRYYTPSRVVEIECDTDDIVEVQAQIQKRFGYYVSQYKIEKVEV